ncbi:hypothetical protein [Clostridium sp.]|uniref:hypothetical protein n=1 Tax=Clostridium sp. TaxID=1506 RepID=UPI00285224E2|nr:hypothetical protein [Clostridium sp.]MDR3597211.1 hypothetical protein [Clostridium sp.]
MKEYYENKLDIKILNWFQIHPGFGENFIKIPTTYSSTFHTTATIPASFKFVIESIISFDHFIYEFIKLKTHSVEMKEKFTNLHKNFLTAYATLELRMMPSVHYICNHLLEDFERYPSLYNLLEESYEAAHKLDRDHSNSCCHGKPQGANDKYNSFAILVAQNLMLHRLEFEGVDEM